MTTRNNNLGRFDHLEVICIVFRGFKEISGTNDPNLMTISIETCHYMPLCPLQILGYMYDRHARYYMINEIKSFNLGH